MVQQSSGMRHCRKPRRRRSVQNMSYAGQSEAVQAQALAMLTAVLVNQGARAASRRRDGLFPSGRTSIVARNECRELCYSVVASCESVQELCKRLLV